MLLQNISLHAQYPGRRMGATATNTDPGKSRCELGLKMNGFAAPYCGGWTENHSYPDGWQFDNGWFPNLVSNDPWQANLGHEPIYGYGSITLSNLAGGRNIQTTILTGNGTISFASLAVLAFMGASLTGLGSLSAAIRGRLDAIAALVGQGDLTGALVASTFLIAALQGSGDITLANLSGAMEMTAALTGQGIVTAVMFMVAAITASLDGAGDLSGDLYGRLDAIASLTGQGDLVGAMTGLASLSATLDGMGDIVIADMPSVGSLTANITSTGSVLTTANIAPAVWDALCEAGITNKEALRVILAALAGKLAGAPGTTIIIRDTNDTKDRITAGVDANGNRTSIALDVSD